MSPDRFREITESALEGLAEKELNLSAIVGRSADAKKRRLVPEVVERSSLMQHRRATCILAPPTAKGRRTYRMGKVAGTLIPIGDDQEHRFGRLGKEYA